MGSKIIWRPKVRVWSDGIFGPRRREPVVWLGVAVLFCGIAAVSMFDIFEELVGEQQTASAETPAFAVSGSVPIVVVNGGERPSRQGQPSPSTGAAAITSAPFAVPPGHVVAETTGSASAPMPSPSGTDSVAVTANTAPTTEQPDVPQPLPKRRIAKKKPARKVDPSPAAAQAATQIYAMSDGRQIAVHRPGRNINSPDGGFWGNEFGARAGAPIQFAHQRAFGWPF